MALITLEDVCIEEESVTIRITLPYEVLFYEIDLQQAERLVDQLIAVMNRANW